jgi:hypothetical protein
MPHGYTNAVVFYENKIKMFVGEFNFICHLKLPRQNNTKQIEGKSYMICVSEISALFAQTFYFQTNFFICNFTIRHCQFSFEKEKQVLSSEN